LSELGLGLFGRARMQSEAAAVLAHALLFLAQVGRGDTR
jgi:hypothetical protein